MSLVVRPRRRDRHRDAVDRVASSPSCALLAGRRADAVSSALDAVLGRPPAARRSVGALPAAATPPAGEDRVVDLAIVAPPDEDRLAGGPDRSRSPMSMRVEGPGEVDRGAEIGRHAGGPQRPPEADDSARRRRPSTSGPHGARTIAGRADHAAALIAGPQASRPPPRDSARAVSPRTRRMSSSYLRTTPRVSSTTSPRQLARAERQERRRPVERLGDAGDLREVGLAEAMDEADDLAGQPLGRLGHAGEDDLELLLGRRVVDPVVQAATLQRVVDLARPVRGQDHPRRPVRLDRADLRNRHLEVRQDLQQVRLELLVGPVDLVDQQDRRPAVGRPRAPGGAAADEELRAEDVMGLTCSASPRASSSRISSICRG